MSENESNYEFWKAFWKNAKLGHLTKSKYMKMPTMKEDLKKQAKLTKKQLKVYNTPYELFQSKNGTWKWRKRAKNRAILNHSYNTKAAAIKGMKADYKVTKEMEEFVYREVKS